MEKGKSVSRRNLLAIIRELAAFVRSAALYPIGQSPSFNLYGANPKTLSAHHCGGRAVLLLHGVHHNQSAWIPLLRKLEGESVGAIYTLNYKPLQAQKQIKQKVEEIRQQFFREGMSSVNLSLVGHSLGGIHATYYAFHPHVHIPGISVARVISIAGRLRWIEDRLSHFAKDIGPLVQETWKRVQRASSLAAPPLFTIAADQDWLVPKESVLVNHTRQQCIIPSSSHLSLLYHEETHHQVIRWLRDT